MKRMQVWLWVVLCCLAVNGKTWSQQRLFRFDQNGFNQPRNSKGGYHELEVTAQTADSKPVDRDTKFNLCIQSGSWRSPIVSSTPLMIESGKSVGTAKLLFQYQDERNLYWWVERQANNRRDSRDLYAQILQLSSSGWTPDPQCYLFLSDSVSVRKQAPAFANVQQIAPNFDTITVGTKTPSFDVLSTLLPESSSYASIQLTGINTTANKQSALRVPSIRTNVPSSLPDNWVGLSHVQNIFISLEDLSNFAELNEEKTSALKKWIAAGGRLVVNGCGDRCVKSQQIYRALRLPPTPLPEWKRLNEQSWKNIWSNFSSSRKRGFGVDVDFLEQTRGGEIYKSHMFEAVPKESTADSEFKPIVSHYVQGQIVAVDGDMTDWDQKKWGFLLATLEAAGSDFHSNIGRSILSGSELPERTILGVKEPNKGTFQFLIVCFVLVAGPLNYFLLNKAKRLNALLLTVPIISLVACFSLFGYAFFVQGFGVKARHDSVTYLDQRNGAAVNRSLHSMFCGLHPGKYQFTNDELVFSPKDQEKSLLIAQSDNQITFAGGAIQPRTPHHLSTVRCFNTQEGLAFTELNGQVKVANHFSDDIELLIFRFNDQLYFLEDLLSESTAAAKKTEKYHARLSFAQKLDELSGSTISSKHNSSGEVKSGTDGNGQKILVLNEPFRVATHSGVNNYILDTASIEAINNPQTYMAVFKSYREAQSLHQKNEMTSGAHVVIGKW